MKLFADDVKLFLAMSDSNSQYSLQCCLDNISSWSNQWQLNLSPAKCAVLSLGRKRFSYSYTINNFVIQHVETFTDLGIIIDPLLKFDDHINSICCKAKQRSALILKCFSSRDPHLLIKAFITFVRPTLEFASCVWSPSSVSLIDKIESVQRSFTKKLSGLRNLEYEERLNILNLQTLENRRIRADLTMYFKIIHDYVDLNAKDFFCVSGNSVTRGHRLKLVKPRCTSNLQL